MLTIIALLIALLFLPSPWNVIVVVSAAVVDLAETGVLVWWSRRRRRVFSAAVGLEAIAGSTGVALGRLSPDGAAPGQVRVDGEIWAAFASEPIDPGMAVTVVSVDGLTLHVVPADRDQDDW